MDENETKDDTATFERLLTDSEGVRYELRLFVSGMTHRSVEAITTIKSLCEEYFPGRYHLEVIDIYQQADRARDDQIIAAPTLLRALPLPTRRFIGGLSDKDRLIRGLEVPVRKSP